MDREYCANCGAEVGNDSLFCTECGVAIKNTITQPYSYQSKHDNYQPVESVYADYGPGNETVYGSYEPPTFETPLSYATEEDDKEYGSTMREPKAEESLYGGTMRETVKKEDPDKYAPISTWGYVGILLISAIPVVGFIFLIVWACGGCQKINKRNFARAQLLVGFVLYILLFILSIIIFSMLTVDLGGINEISSIIQQMPA